MSTYIRYLYNVCVRDICQCEVFVHTTSQSDSIVIVSPSTTYLSLTFLPNYWSLSCKIFIDCTFSPRTTIIISISVSCQPKTIHASCPSENTALSISYSSKVYFRLLSVREYFRHWLMPPHNLQATGNHFCFVSVNSLNCIQHIGYIQPIKPDLQTYAVWLLYTHLSLDLDISLINLSLVSLSLDLSKCHSCSLSIYQLTFYHLTLFFPL